MSKPFKTLYITQQAFSLCFETTCTIDIKALKLELFKLFPNLNELTNSFDRINLLFDQPMTEAAIDAKIKPLNWSDFKRKQPAHFWEIPLCFDPHYPSDLRAIFNDDQTAVNEYCSRFLSTTYYLEFYGFLPGFGYLSGLPKSCHLDRKSTANQKTLKGTVAVGGAQAGVYPQDSPGGWQAIGFCPVPWIQPQHSPYVFIQPGDAVRFKAIDLKECQAILQAVEEGTYQPKQSAYD